MQRRDFIKVLGGVAAAWPLAARAQQPAIPVIGFLHAGSAATVPQYHAAFREGLAEAGFIEGKNVSIESRFADQHLERLPALAMDLVRRQVAVIATGGGSVPPMIAKGATSTIPIVFVMGLDPVKSGLVASLNRPGGNVTGATVIASQLGGKRLELLRDLVPAMRLVAVLINQDSPNAETDVTDLQAAARTLGIQIEFLKASDEREVDMAFISLAQSKADALLLDPDPLFTTLRQKIVAQAERQTVPAIYYSREYTDGALISYGASFAVAYRQAGTYVGRILKGEKPADLPVVQPTKFELVINLKTAKALGLTVPPALIARADEVIE
jgi:putative tryptophan/tyrosine transport system substrate-binding protein